MNAPTTLNPTDLLKQLNRTALDHEIGELSNRLKALAILRKACAARDGEEMPKNRPGPGKRRKLPGADNGRDGSPLEHLTAYLRACGTAKPKVIAADLNIDDAIIDTILETNADRFMRTPQGYALRRKEDG